MEELDKIINRRSCFLFHEEHKEDKEKLRNILEFPENIELVSLIALGYKDDSEEIRDKEINDYKNIVSFDKYSNKV